jgi:hypothetical protein
MILKTAVLCAGGMYSSASVLQNSHSAVIQNCVFIQLQIFMFCQVFCVRDGVGINILGAEGH